VAVSEAYLKKIRRGVRVEGSAEIDAELTDIIEECRADLEQLGVLSTKTADETDALILGAVRSFARWKFGLPSDDTEKSAGDYQLQRDELRRRTDYTVAV
jgi:hypothetical protein